MKNKWTYVLIVGVLVSISSGPFIFDLYQPLTIEVIENHNGLEGGFRLYDDLDEDGDDEIISPSLSTKGVIGISMKGVNYPTWQENFEGTLFTVSEFTTSNINGNKLREFPIIYFRNDSIFLGIIEYGSFELLIIDRFLSTFKWKGRSEDNVYLSVESFDFTNDGEDEIIMNIMNGYGIYPRRLFVYYPKEDTIYSTPPEWEAYIGNTQIVDLDGDNDFEITVSGFAPGNSLDTTIAAFFAMVAAS